MEFKILGHACLLIKTKTHSVIIDPWLIGSCYWRSWWNFPGAVFDEQELRGVDAVIISHIHWDHWHGPTLKRFFKGKHVIVPDEPSIRSRNDLRAIGFKSVEPVPHAKTVTVGDIEITLHQFGLFLNDAAIVIQADGKTLLNANDAKIAGRSLRALLRQHGKIDFAFRSHSSANSRINHKIYDEIENFISDDREHYFRSFCLFMDAVEPHYAIPFASNHCHLHDDTINYNGYISNPLELRRYYDENKGGAANWSLKVMLPGSQWSECSGFQLASEEPFKNTAHFISEYRERVKVTLEKYREQELAVDITSRTMVKFLEMLSVKLFFERHLPDFILKLEWPDGRAEAYEVSPARRSVDPTDAIHQPKRGLPMIKMPAIVFRDAVRKNMFHHAGISKRCDFLAFNASDMKALKKIFGRLEATELSVRPLNFSYVRRFIHSYLLRWRELFVYATAAFLIIYNRKPIYIIEEDILIRSKRWGVKA
jgi:UDP-MurNAc hydroxylase